MKKRLGCALALSLVAGGAISAHAARAAELVLQSGGGGVGRGTVVSRDGHWLAKGGLEVWDARRGELVRRIAAGTGEEASLTPLQFSPDGRLLLSQVRDNYGATKYVSLRLVPSLREVHRLRFIEAPLFFDGRVVRGTFGSDLKEWSAQTGRLLSKRPLQDAPEAKMTARSLAFSHNGRFLAFRGDAHEPARIWDGRGGRLLRRFEAGDGSSGEAAVSDDGCWLAIAQSYERSSQVKVWDIRAGRLRRSIGDAGGSVNFERGARSLWAWSGQSAALWSLSSGRKMREIPGSNPGDAKVPGDSVLWPAEGRDGLQLWDVRSGRLARTLPGSLGGASPLAWSPDGKYLAGGNDLQVWDVGTGALLSLVPNTYVQRLRWRDSQTLHSENLQQAQTWRVEGGAIEAAGGFAPRFPPPEHGV